MAPQDDELRDRLLATFRSEADEHLQRLTASLLALEGGLAAAEERAVLEAMFREVHTLKGAARSVSLLEVEALCRACESVLSALTQGNIALSAATVASLQAALDGIGDLVVEREEPKGVDDLIDRLERIAAGVAARPPVVATRPMEGAGEPGALKPPSPDSIRLATAKLDALLLKAEELLIPKLAAAERVREAGALVDALGRLHATARKNGRGAGRTDLEGRNGARPEEFREELAAIVDRAGEALAQLVRDQRRIVASVDGVLEQMRRLRMTPASSVLDLFPRMVRDLADEEGREVEWVVKGADLEVDRKVLEAMKDPLIHLVRNAVAHGIEPPEARVEAGKPRRGRVTVAVAPLESGRVEILVQDDGQGIDVSRIRAAAVEARLVSAEAADAMGKDDALALAYRSGLSTSPIITGVSGHGLGLAIVKEQVERRDGRISLESRPGAGTTIRMVLPATIATFRGLLVGAGRQPFLLPLEAVERAVRFTSADVAVVEEREAIRWDGRAVPIARLDALLGQVDLHEPPETQETLVCVILRSGEERAGLIVDEILGDREVLVKELAPPLVRVRNIAGAGLLGTGTIVPILRPHDLLTAVQQTRRAAEPAEPAEAEVRQLAVLIVDDSITTRTMEKNLLEAAGYRVSTAVDGVEAWTKLKSEAFDAVISDVDMPRMDGFELTARIRADEKLAELPVVLVTALESREDKERGIEVGASAYVVKSSFDQSNLLTIIGRLA